MAAEKVVAITPTPQPIRRVEVQSNELSLTAATAAKLDPTAEFQLGVEAEADQDFAHIRKRRLTIFVNSTSIDNRGVHTLETFGESVLVSPSKVVILDDGVTTETLALKDWRAKNPTAKVFKLGPDDFRPTEEMLKDSEALVWDIALPGSRSSLEAAVLGAALQEASLHYQSFVVLDRPAVMDVQVIDGPTPDEDSANTRAVFLPIPEIPGMTAGELAQLYNQVYGIEADLKVVPMGHWKRSDGNKWLQDDPIWEQSANGSRNLKNLRESPLYSHGFAELMAVRELLAGTPFALRRLEANGGKPRLLLGPTRVDTATLLERLSGMSLDGAEAKPLTTAIDGGTSTVLSLTPLPAPEQIQPVLLTLQLQLCATRDPKTDLSVDGPNAYAARSVLQALSRGLTPDQVRRRWAALPPYQSFLADREKALLYPP